MGKHAEHRLHTATLIRPAGDRRRVRPAPPGYVSREMLGDDWPLTVEDGVLDCSGAQAVTFTTGGGTYAVNGMAESATDFPAIDPIWADDPTGAAPKKNIGPLIERGLALCD